jgi:CDP-glycerol glycerophosphotransferase
MDNILKEMLYDVHVTDNEILKKSTWKNLKTSLKGNKKLVLFGAGKAAEKFIYQIQKKYKIEYILDNDIKKSGSFYNDIEIKHPSELKDKDKIIILITSTAYMDTIANQLNELGIKEYYGLLMLESGRFIYKIKYKFITFMLYKLLPINKNKIVFNNKINGTYSCHMKYIAEELIKRKTKYKLVWLSSNIEECPKEIKVVNSTELRELYELATAKIRIYNDHLHMGTRKRKGQIYINTWHGSIPLKKVGLDIKHGLLKRNDNKHVINTSKITDYYISNGGWCSELYRNAFAYNGEIIEAGSPRIDVLFKEDNEAKEKIKNKYRLPSDARVVMYAPTFREDSSLKMSPNSKDLGNIVNCKIIETLERKYGYEFYLLVRLHPRVANSSITTGDNKKIINVTSAPDIYELLSITDVFITDYSSTMFELGSINKPVFLYATDVEHYIKEERDFYFDYFSLPFPISQTIEELKEEIENFNREKYEAALKKFNTEVIKVKENGDASKIVVDKIINIMDGKDCE